MTWNLLAHYFRHSRNLNTLPWKFSCGKLCLSFVGGFETYAWLVIRSKTNREAALSKEMVARLFEVYYLEIQVQLVGRSFQDI